MRSQRVSQDAGRAKSATLARHVRRRRRWRRCLCGARAACSVCQASVRRAQSAARAPCIRAGSEELPRPASRPGGQSSRARRRVAPERERAREHAAHVPRPPGLASLAALRGALRDRPPDLLASAGAPTTRLRLCASCQLRPTPGHRPPGSRQAGQAGALAHAHAHARMCMPYAMLCCMLQLAARRLLASRGITRARAPARSCQDRRVIGE